MSGVVATTVEVSTAWLNDLRLLLLIGFFFALVLAAMLLWGDPAGSPRPRRRRSTPDWSAEEYCPVGRRQRVECPHCATSSDDSEAAE